MPSRLVLGQAPVWQGVLSAAISIAATAALVPVATKIYARAALRSGRVRIRQVLRAERRA
jgi:ABC-2 type transport system permease protein